MANTKKKIFRDMFDKKIQRTDELHTSFGIPGIKVVGVVGTKNGELIVKMSLPKVETITLEKFMEYFGQCEIMNR